MLRIRLLTLIYLLLPAAAFAAPPAMEQEGAWVLRTATTAKMTKDYFCASDAKFSNQYGMVVARNILGQTSLLLTWPGMTGSDGMTVPLRISLDGKPLRDALAVLKTNGLLIAPLGWDDDAIQQLANAKQVSFSTAKANVQLRLKENEAAFNRLNSCTASLLDRLPDTGALSTPVRNTLNKAGLGHGRSIQVIDNLKAENFIVDGIFGGSTPLDSDKSDITQRMLDYVDQLELLCRAQFSSKLGAPNPINGGEIITAEAKCDAQHTGNVTALVFVNNGSSPRVYYFEGDKERMPQITALRDLVAKSLK
jgi:hypothetical protein